MNGTDRPRERISVEYMIMEFQENMSRRSNLEIEVFGLSDVRSLGFWTGCWGIILFGGVAAVTSRMEIPSLCEMKVYPL